MSKSTVLLASVDDTLIESVRSVVASIESLHLEVLSSASRACDRIRGGGVVLVVVHLKEGDDVAEMTDLLQMIALDGHPIVTLGVSDHYQATQALAMLRLGVADYLARPLDLGRLAYLIDVLTLRARRVAPESMAVQPVELIEDDRSFIYMPTTTMGRTMEQIKRVAPQETTILLGGETGTGKSRLADLIHRMSPRRGEPFLTINCGALSSHLVESEMFGHVKGAFTGADGDRLGKFAEVGRGTLFLDEVDSLPLAVQAKLLRAVEERAFEAVGSNKTCRMQARLIAASNRPLEQEVAAGRFRTDLFYRLNVVAFTVPPLRERTEVVPHLVRGFIDEVAIRSGRPVHEISGEALSALQAHDWPGNIRELRNVIERAVALCAGYVIELDDLPDLFHQLAHNPPPTMASLAVSKNRAEQSRIAEVLHRNKNNKLRKYGMGFNL